MFDTDDSGTITALQLAHALQTLGKPVTREELHELIRTSGKDIIDDGGGNNVGRSGRMMARTEDDLEFTYDHEPPTTNRRDPCVRVVTRRCERRAKRHRHTTAIRTRRPFLVVVLQAPPTP